jgi:uncharacterized protein with NAD-binding domain and iron-sulfur cluster
MQLQEDNLPKVIILGAGMGGLAAAHELLEPERAYTVEIYEKNQVPGGKARSTTPPPTSPNGKPGLPNEHGFRFFPGFYRHVYDTMQRINTGNDTVADHLVQAKDIIFARAGEPALILPARAPQPFSDWLTFTIQLYKFHQKFPLPREKIWIFIKKIICFLGSGKKRREHTYDETKWSDYIEADKHGDEYKKFLANGLTRSLVAMQPERASTLTVATILAQVLLDILDPGKKADRVLDGPTSEIWIEPWMKHLRKIGNAGQRRFFEYFEHEVISLEYDNQANRIVSATVKNLQTGADLQVGSAADHFICALPVEVVQKLLTPTIKIAANISGIDQLCTRWMTGVLTYINRDIKEPNGHVIYLDSPWALTSIDQQQFWKNNGTDISETYGNGNVKDIVSAIISEWEMPGKYVAKKAKETANQDEIFTEVWEQIKAHRDAWPSKEGRLEHKDKVHMWLDTAIGGFGSIPLTNTEPLLVNVVGSHKHRPEAVTLVPNLFLASDYVHTHTDLATMEAANESARRAVVGILDMDDPTKIISRPNVFPLKEPVAFDWLKKLDDEQFEFDMDTGGKPRPPLICDLLEKIPLHSFIEVVEGYMDPSELLPSDIQGGLGFLPGPSSS